MTDPTPLNEHGFPDATPIREMTPENDDVDPSLRPLLQSAVESELRRHAPWLTTEEATELVRLLRLSRFRSPEGGIDVEHVQRFAARLAPPAPKPEPFDYRKILQPNPTTSLDGARAREITRHR